jgi:hypothetical protein
VTIAKAGKVVLIVLLTLISGYADSQGFLHAARVWADGKWVWPAVARSAAGYAFGVLAYWMAIRYLQEFGVVSPEIQTLGWFVVTIVGVALFSGDFLRWQMSERLVSLGVLFGLIWLVFRTGG